MKSFHKVTLVALLWLILINPALLPIDTSRRAQMAHAWWTGGEEVLMLEPDFNVIIDGKRYIPYDLGQPMLMLPIDYLGSQLGLWLPSELTRAKFSEAIISFLVFIPINLCVVLVCFWILRQFNLSERISALACLTWLLGTTVLHYSAVHQQNNQVLLFVLFGYGAGLCYIRKQQFRFSVLSGLSLGAAFLTRITSAIDACCVFLFLTGCIIYNNRSGFQSVKPLIFWLTGFAPFFVLERVLTKVRYGSWQASSASMHMQMLANNHSLGDNASFESTQVPFDNTFLQEYVRIISQINFEGLLGPFFSLEKSFFIFDPLLLPCLILAILSWKRLSLLIQLYVLVCTLDLGMYLLLYSQVVFWHADPFWGARYHLTSIHLLLVPLVPLLVQLFVSRKQIVAWLSRSLLALALAVQIFSIILPADLEVHQQELGVGSSFRLAQRVENISHLLTNTFDNNHDLFNVASEQELSREYTPDKIASDIRFYKTWRILPFFYSQYLRTIAVPNVIIGIIFVAWITVFLVTIGATVWIIRSI
jgi:hypothetical protein